jgi:hypothetical protein
MGKAIGKKIFTFTRTTGDFSHNWSDGCHEASLCFFDVRRAFDVALDKVVDFHVTDKRPKSMTNWHFLRKDGYSSWRLSSGSHGSVELMGSACSLLNDNFPDKKTLYVCAYA